MAPAGEHMAHLLSWAMGAGLTAVEALAMPFYHPVPEEALRPALDQIIKHMVAPVPDSQIEFGQEPG